MDSEASIPVMSEDKAEEKTKERKMVNILFNKSGLTILMPMIN